VADGLPEPRERELPEAAERASGEPAETTLPQVQEKTWASLGLERDAAGLGPLLAYLEGVRRPKRATDDRRATELRNVIDVARAMAAAALFREESRGGHFRTDFPETDDARFHGHTMLDGGGPRLVGIDEILPGRAC
jgi:L-aspartate oxidase